MADYDWGKGCCGMTVGHADDCPEHPILKKVNARAAELRPLGFIYDHKTKAFFCRRGCGTLVWNPEEHMENVCTKFEPVAGD